MISRQRVARSLTRALILAAYVSSAPESLSAAQPTAQPVSADSPLVVATLAWEAGDYVTALSTLANILRGPDAARHREAIALLTGENWHTTFVAEDARAPHWAPDGRHLAYETGARAALVTRVAANTPDYPTVAEVNGTGLVFAPNGAQFAYLTGSAENVAIVLRDIASGAEQRPALNGIIPAQLAYQPDGQLLFVGAPAGGSAGTSAGAPASASVAPRTALYQLASDVAPRQLSRTDSVVADVRVASTGQHLLYAIGGRSPALGAGGTAFARGPSRTRFAVLSLSAGNAAPAEREFVGTSPALSADGTTLAFVVRDNDTNAIHLLDLTSNAPPRVVHATTDSLTNPALSPNGSHITFQQRPREDWELFTIDRDGTTLERVTREIQHDLFPQWLDERRLLAVIGEGRHRRSHLYTDGSRYRLFHNNTVRTIAPEYEWSPSADGNQLLVVAERDGDTVTPHRHLWCMDLTREVTVSELLERVQASLTAERALRDSGVRTFAPIADVVRDAVAEVNTNRVYGYARDLFSFDSKHITQPGNALAREWLTATYRSFGYTDVQAQTFEPRVAVNRPTISTANILAVLPGTVHPELVYVISSHFDSRAEGAGADDNSSGTSALLETARVLATRPQAATIIFASFTGEESGLLGSREFVRQAKASGLRLVGALNNDMVGWANDQRLDNTIRYSNAGIRDIQHAAAIGFTNLITYDAFYYKSTDAQAFYDGYGDVVGGIGSYPVLGNPHYHQPHDVLETINHQLVAEVAKTTIASIMYLASSPSRLANLAARAQSGDRAELTWDASPERDVSRYVVTWGLPANPEEHRREVSEARATINNAPAGTVVAVKAVNARGLHGWDWARTLVDLQR